MALTKERLRAEGSGAKAMRSTPREAVTARMFSIALGERKPWIIR
jgi:hypothetical protein